MPVSKKPNRRMTGKLHVGTTVIPAGWGIPDAQSTHLCLIPHSALSDLIARRGIAFHWNTVAFRLHMGKKLAERNTPYILHEMEMAVHCHGLVLDRKKRTEEWRLTGAEALLIGDGLNYTDELQRLTTRREQQQAGIALINENRNNLRAIGITSEDQVVRWLK